MRAINLKPDKTWRIVLAVLPFLLLLSPTSSARQSAGRESQRQAAAELRRHGRGDPPVCASSPITRTGDYLLWADTAASLTRLLSALAISTAIALVVGIVIGLLPVAGATLRARCRGRVDGPAARAAADPVHHHGPRRSVEDHADRHRHDAEAHPRSCAARRRHSARATDQGADARRLDVADRARASCCRRCCRASSMPCAWRSDPAWLFLIAAEAIAADSGLGYRIFLVRRYLSMDVILPYVAWITLLAFVMDLWPAASAAQGLPWFAQARAA